MSAVAPTRPRATLVLGLLLVAAGLAGAGEAATSEAEALLLAGEAESALERFRVLVARNPHDGRAAAGLVEALLVLDRWREALAEAERLGEELPGDPRVTAARGEALFRAGRLEQAERLLVEPCSEPDAAGRALSLLGMLRVARGRGAEAIELMDRAVAASPEDRRVLFRAAEATAERAVAVARLERYLARAGGDDPDRIEAATGTLRVLRALGERPIWVPLERPGVVDIPLRLLAAGEGRLRGGVVNARLGPKRRAVRLLLDTGSSGLFLIERAARRGQFEALAEETTFGGGGERRHASRRGLLAQFALGELAFADALGTASPGELDPVGRYHGVLGVSVFEGYRVVLDLRRGRLELRADTDEPLDGAPYWTIAGQMLVRAGVAGGPDGLFLFDTGASHSLVDLEFARRVDGARLGEPASVRGFGGALKGVRRVDGIALTFAGLVGQAQELSAADLSLRSRLGGVEVSGYLGMDLLEETRITIDTRHRRVRLDAAD